MAPDAAATAPLPRTRIVNIGLILSGDIGAPLCAGDALVLDGGRIRAIGRTADLPPPDAGERVIDARGAAVCPGFIDNHVHPAAGDWTPRQNQLGWMESSVHGGVTTMISAGEVHLPGRPRDRAGVKALAVAAQRMFAGFRPLGLKVIAGAPLPEPELTEEDFRELAAAGVTLVGEFGLGGVKDGPTGRRMIGWARAAGMTSMTHAGGPSIPGSARIGAEVVLEVDADIVAHVNGGPTALPEAEIERLCAESPRAIEIVHNGNLRAGLRVAALMREAGALGRLVLGTDSPAGSGVQPLGMIRTVTHLAALGGLAPELAVCLATGNVARVRGLADRGTIAPGKAADLVFLDAPEGGGAQGLLEAMAEGNIPGIGMVLIDGEVRVARSRNTPPARRFPVIVAG